MATEKRKLPKMIRPPKEVTRFQMERERVVGLRQRAVSVRLRELHGIEDLDIAPTRAMGGRASAQDDEDGPSGPELAAQRVREMAANPPAERGMPMLYLTGLSQVQLTIQSQVGQDETVATRWDVYGTHSEELLGIAPTQREVEFSGSTLTKFDDDRMTEEWTYWDLPRLMEQLGRPL